MLFSSFIACCSLRFWFAKTQYQNRARLERISILESDGMTTVSAIESFKPREYHYLLVVAPDED